MQIVIDIPKDIYDFLQENDTGTQVDRAIANGIPLPEGHGRIGDLDQLLLWMIYKKGIIDNLKCGEIAPVFKDATIIEAESE